MALGYIVEGGACIEGGPPREGDSEDLVKEIMLAMDKRLGQQFWSDSGIASFAHHSLKRLRGSSDEE